MARAAEDAAFESESAAPSKRVSMGWAQSRSRAACLYQPDVLWLRRHRLERLVRPLALLPELRNEPPSGPQRRQEYREAWAKPSGTRGLGRLGEPRTPCL